jgi:starch synthase
MQAMTYGTIPVVTPVGGLVDTVVDADRHPDLGNGFASRDVSTAGFVAALHRATAAWRSATRRRQVIGNGMRADWSWEVPAADYVAEYRAACASAAQRARLRQG